MAKQRRFILNNNNELNDIEQRVQRLILDGAEDQTEEGIVELKKDANNLEINPFINDTPSATSEITETGTLSYCKESDKGKDLKTTVNDITKRILEDESTESEMERQPLKKLNDNQKLRKLIRLGNSAVKEIVSKQPEEYNCITNLNKLI